MPVSTRSKTRGGQPPPQAISSRDDGDHPRRLANSRQGNAVVNMSADAGSPSTSGMLAHGNHPVDLTPCHCHHQRC